MTTFKQIIKATLLILLALSLMSDKRADNEVNNKPIVTTK